MAQTTCLILFSYGKGSQTPAKLVQNLNNTDWNKFVGALEPLYFDDYITSTADLNFRAKCLMVNIKSAFDIACPPKKALPFTPVNLGLFLITPDLLKF